MIWKMLWLYKLRMLARKLLRLPTPIGSCYACGYSGRHTHNCYSVDEYGECDGWSVECGRCGELLSED